MMDQQNFEATRPVSADPAVALAEALGQLPKAPPKIPSPKAKFETPATVESLAEDHGLKLGDQTGLTIRRIKRGKGYSFIRANGTAIRQVGTIKRLNSMAVPPAYRDVRYSADPTSHLQAVGVDAAGRHRTGQTDGFELRPRGRAQGCDFAFEGKFWNSAKRGRDLGPQAACDALDH